LAPFDTIKTVQQQARQGVGAKALSFVEAAGLVVRRPRGIFELYAGLGVAAIGAMPSVGLYFGIYSYSKRTIIPRLQQTLGPTREGSYIISDNAATTIGIAASAAIGNTFASFSRVPFEVVKQRLQTGKYPNTRTALAAMFRSEGMRGFFPLGGICTQMVRDIPYAVVTLCTYEAIQDKWIQRSQVQQQSWKDMASGAIAGGVGSFLTNPMDVVKTVCNDGCSLLSASLFGRLLHLYTGFSFVNANLCHESQRNFCKALFCDTFFSSLTCIWHN